MYAENLNFQMCFWIMYMEISCIFNKINFNMIENIVFNKK